MERDYTEVMSKRTDEQLIKIVKIDRDGYEPEAVIAAEKELEKRNIDDKRIEEINQEEIELIEEEKKVQSNTVASSIRFVNFLVDFILLIFVLVIINVIVGLFTAIFLPNLSDTTINIIGYSLNIFGWGFYYVFFENKYQKTLGKVITKTKVVTYLGEKPTLNEILARTFYRIIPFDRLSFLFTRNGIHDFLSKTKVVKDDN